MDSLSPDRTGWQRLADVQVPHGILWVLVIGSLIGKRRTDRALADFAKTTGEFGTFMGGRMRQGDAQTKQLLDLQASIERLTRWLVRLTIALGVIGVAGIAATVVAALA